MQALLVALVKTISLLVIDEYILSSTRQCHSSVLSCRLSESFEVGKKTYIQSSLLINISSSLMVMNEYLLSFTRPCHSFMRSKFPFTATLQKIGTQAHIHPTALNNIGSQTFSGYKLGVPRWYCS